MSIDPAVIGNNVPFSGALTRSQFMLVQKLLLPWWASKWMRLLWLVLLYVCLADDTSADVATAGGPSSHAANISAITWIFLFVLRILFSPGTWSLAILICVTWGATTWIRHRQWRRIEAAHTEVSGHIGDNGIAWNTPLTTANYPCANLTRVRQHPEMLLVFYSPRCAFYLPKNFFRSEAAWGDANALALRHDPRKRRSA